MINVDFSLSRSFDAPRAALFKAWTDATDLGRWMIPAGYTNIFSSMDLRVGGSYHYGLSGATGQQQWGKWIFREIRVARRLVMVQSFADAAGGLMRHPYSPSWPLETLATVTFSERGAGSALALTCSPLDATPEEQQFFADGHAGMRRGWSGTLAQLDVYLSSQQD